MYLLPHSRGAEFRSGTARNAGLADVDVSKSAENMELVVWAHGCEPE